MHAQTSTFTGGHHLTSVATAASPERPAPGQLALVAGGGPSDAARPLRKSMCGPVPATAGPFELGAVVEEVRELRRSAWLRQGIEVAIACEPTPESWGNRHQILQVLLNLVVNAEDAVYGRSRPLIEIRVHSERGDAVVEVIDNGTGMDRATLARVFDPAFTTKRHGPGLGLGMARNIVNAHGGELAVESVEGSGSAFKVVLPGSRGTRTAGAAGTGAPVEGSPHRVLVVEDDPGVRRVFERALGVAGYECTVVEEPAAIAELADVASFDAIVCDVRLRGGGHTEVLRLLEARAPQLIPHTVVATTSMGEFDERTARKLGLTLMSKPFGLSDLMEALHTAMNR